jgi:hypothetical protein
MTLAISGWNNAPTAIANGSHRQAGSGRYSNNRPPGIARRSRAGASQRHRRDAFCAIVCKYHVIGDAVAAFKIAPAVGISRSRIGRAADIGGNGDL